MKDGSKRNERRVQIYVLVYASVYGMQCKLLEPTINCYQVKAS
jgi:hypothetical protein